MATSISKSVKDFVAQRSLFCCEYCLSQARYSVDYFSIEHILPRSKGGGNDVMNLAYACRTCNGHKYTHTVGVDPLDGRSASLYNPRTDVWNEHFRWSDDCSIIIGISPCGRGTVERLKLNRPSLINLRTVLFSFGKHPVGGY